MSRIRYGGDYNPEQWPEEVWAEDRVLMRRAGVNLVTVGVFSWAELEPREGEYEFAWLDRVLDGLHEAGVRVDLATATASPPPWLSARHPEMLPVTAEGVRLHPGSRQQYCPSSPVYREHAARLVRAIAERYGSHPALELWHVNNEYGCHVSHCYCDVSAEAFRRWLVRGYGTVEELNRAWGTAFWSQRYGGFEEVWPPRAAPTFRNPTQLIDFDRFSSDELLDLHRAEVAILREATPDVPITTNFMGFFKPTDYWRWAEHVDLVSNDSYPDPADPRSPALSAMSQDLMRSLAGGRPWLLMEQASSAVNWRAVNAPKRPGQMRAWSLQAVARGADGILFFQWRQSVAGAEKFHSGLVPHAGTDTRVWREVEALGAELAGLSDVVGEAPRARVAIVLDWDSWWALEQEATPASLLYPNLLFAWYRPFFDRSLLVDFARAGADLSAYDLVVVPAMHVASPAAIAALDAYVRQGGRLLVTFQTAILDPDLHVQPGGYLGALRETLGVRVEEFAPLAAPELPGAEPPVVALAGSGLDGSTATQWTEYVHVADAEAVAMFAEGDVAGWPALTRRTLGEGKAWYVATLPDEAGRDALVATLLAEAGIEVARGARPGREVLERAGRRFAIDHAACTVEVEPASRR